MQNLRANSHDLTHNTRAKSFAIYAAKPASSVAGFAPSGIDFDAPIPAANFSILALNLGATAADAAPIAAVTPRTRRRRRTPTSPPPTATLCRPPRPPPSPGLSCHPRRPFLVSLPGGRCVPRHAWLGPSRRILPPPPCAPCRFCARQRGCPGRHLCGKSGAGSRLEGMRHVRAQPEDSPDASEPLLACHLPFLWFTPRPGRLVAVLRGLAAVVVSWVGMGVGVSRQRTLLGSVDFPASFAVLSAGFAGRRQTKLAWKLQNLPAGFAGLCLAGFASFLACF